MLRAIREIEPRWIIGENVYGLVSWNDGMVFEEVQVDLENEGYEVQPYILPAASVNAPHRRDRVWFVATNTRNHSDRLQTERGLGVDGQLLERREWGKEANRLGDNSQDDNATNTSDKGLQGSEVNGSITSIRQERNEQPTRCIPPTWDEFPTQPPVCGGDDGIPRELDSITFSKWRNESIKAYGNAIVPQVAYQLFKTIEKYMFCKP
jgi:DNA (cytosine-5)-methyltransferase 1